MASQTVNDPGLLQPARGSRPRSRLLLAAMVALAPFWSAAAQASSASADDVRPGAVFVYAWGATQDPVPLDGGGSALAAEFDEPPSSYVPLDAIQASEESLFPRRFDATVAVLNESAVPPGRVEVTVSVRARIGPFVEDAATGMTDLRRGEAEAVWEKKPLLHRRRVFQLEKGRRYYSAKLEGFPFRDVVERLAAAGRWPFELEVVAELSCARCAKGQRVTRRLSVTPGD